MQLVHDDESVRRGISVSGVYVKLNGLLVFGEQRGKMVCKNASIKDESSGELQLIVYSSG